jgi:hypothetical protein
MRLDDTLPEHEKRHLLTTLGVDVDDLPDFMYSRELICDRIRRFCEVISKLRNSLDKLLRDANFELETTEKAT